MLAKTFMTDATMRISYAQYKSHGGSVKEAPAMRLRLYSPTLNKFATVLWVRPPVFCVGSPYSSNCALDASQGQL